MMFVVNDEAQFAHHRQLAPLLQPQSASPKTKKWEVVKEKLCILPIPYLRFPLLLVTKESVVKWAVLDLIMGSHVHNHNKWFAARTLNLLLFIILTGIVARSNKTTMKLAFAIATIAALQQPSIARADCAFGSNYTPYFNSSGYCSSFEVAVGMITQSSTSSTTSSGDTNVTTYDELRDMAIWKVGDKDSTVQCYPSISFESVFTTYPNGSTYNEASGDFEIGLDSTVNSVADGVPLAVPGLYFFKGGRFVFWGSWDSSTEQGGNWDITDVEGDITDLCEVLGGGGGGHATATTDSSNGDTPAEASSTCADFDTLSYRQPKQTAPPATTVLA